MATAPCSADRDAGEPEAASIGHYANEAAVTAAVGVPGGTALDLKDDNE